MTLSYSLSAVGRCAPENAYVTRSATIYGTMTTLNVKPGTQKNTRVGVIQFGRDAPYDDIICDKNSYVYGTIPRYKRLDFYQEIDGQPAYYFPDSNQQYAFVFYDKATGKAFNINSNTDLPVINEIYISRSAYAVIYAAKDNPSSFTSRDFLNIATLWTNANQTGYPLYYEILSGGINIVPGPPSCTIDASSQNLTMMLPRISITKFPKIGFPTNDTSATDTINLSCTGEVTAQIKLEANTGNINGTQSLIKIDDEGSADNAEGFGFVLTGELKGDNELISSDQWVDIGYLTQGASSVKLKARYYRYKDKISAGRAAATANFTIRFN